ncbi:MAG: hypothetical protein ABI363_02895 [Nitrosospira sp.]
MMMQSHVPALGLIAVAFLGLFISLAQAEILTGQVVKIADGDTLTVLDASKQHHRIRLTGIDAPVRIPRSFGHSVHAHSATDSTMIRPPWSGGDAR